MYLILYTGKTGRVAFDEMGDRMFAEYEIINIQKNTQTKQQYQSNKGVSEVPVGSYKYDKVSSGQTYLGYTQ